MDRSEIETEASPAVKNLRSRFEQLAATSSSGTHTTGGTRSFSGGDYGISSNASSSSFARDTTTTRVPYTVSLNTNVATTNVDQAISPSPSPETSQNNDLKAAALKRPPPPPPPSRNSKLQTKRSLSPMPSMMGPSPLMRPVPLPPTPTPTGDPPPPIVSVSSLKSKFSEKPPVPPRPSTIAAQPLTPDPSPIPSEDDEPVDSRLSAFPPPPRHRASLSPNLQSIDGLPPSNPTPPPPLPIRRGTVPVPISDVPLQRSPPTPRINTMRPPPSPRPETNGNESPDFVAPSPVERRPLGSNKLPPPPTRTIAPGTALPPVRPPSAESSDEEDDEEGPDKVFEQLPDSSDSSRRPPLLSFRPGYPEPRIQHHAHSGSVLVSGPNVIVAHGGNIKVYNLESTDPLPVHTVELKKFGLKDSKVSCMEFRPCQIAENRGYLVWIGTKEGSILEFDIRKGSITAMKPAAHLHAITYICRHARSMMTLDESGKALIFSPDNDEDINLKDTQPRVVRTTDKQDFVKLLGGKLWTSGKAEYHSHGNRTIPVVRVYDIFNTSAPAKSLLPSDYVGRLTAAAIIPTRPGHVYLGHEEGFVSIWSLNTEDGWPQCEEVVRVSISDIMSLEGVNDKLWAGGRGGMISAYDVRSTPWTVTNSWVAHPGLPVMKLFVNYYAIEMNKKLCVVSLGRDECVRFWDGLLGLDWIDNELIKNEASFSTFQDITLLLVTFNLSAVKPESLNSDAQNQEFFNEVFASVDHPPDVLAFSFQEVVDLEKRRVMTKSVILSSTGKKPDALSERVTGNYRRWYDRLVGAVKTGYMPLGVEYDVVHVESLVGLFSCIFVRKTDQFTLRDIAIASIKRGLGGRYGNKGAIICRLVINDSSICFVNCHLAAGQHSVRRRNADVTAFMEDKALFTPSTNEITYVGGGDGSMIMDHELVLWNGDMNYRIDLRREAALSAIRTGDLSHLRSHDQLLREMKTNRGFRLRGFNEGPLNFLPTYKYDPHTNNYDTSEKRRVPAWCDRVLWRSRVPTRVKQLHYKRYDNVNVSDHRPVSSAFGMTIKRIQGEARARSKAIVEVAWMDEVERLLGGAYEFYVRQALL